MDNSEGLARFDPTYELIFENIERDLGLSLVYAEEAVSISSEYGDSLKIVKSGRVRAHILRRLGQTTEAIDGFLADFLADFVGSAGWVLPADSQAQHWHCLNGNYYKQLINKSPG